MKVVLLPFFKLLLVIIILLVSIVGIGLASLCILIWSFRIAKWSEFMNNHGDWMVRTGYADPRQDNNLKETIVRLWNLDFYE